MRTAGWELLTECLKHASSTDLERKEYFQTLTATTNSEDFHLELAALVDLTKNGRVLSGFDYEILPLVSNWLHKVCRERKFRHDNPPPKGAAKPPVSAEEKNLARIFTFTVDVIKFSSNVADEASISNMIDGLLGLCMSTSVRDE